MMRFVCIAVSVVSGLSACSPVMPPPSHPETSHSSFDESAGQAPGRLGPPAPASAPRSSADAPATPGQLQLGHYATRDGLFGLVIDRTGPIPLARVDGNPTVFELAVRRGNTVTELISLEGEIVISIDANGRHSIVHSAPEVSLMRDGDAEALPRSVAPRIDGALLRRSEQRVKSRCATEVRFAEVKPEPGSERGLYHGLHRAARALVDVCADDLGKAAVRRGVKTVRLAQAKAGPADIRLESGELVIGARFDDEAFGPFTDELRRFLESHL